MKKNIAIIILLSICITSFAQKKNIIQIENQPTRILIIFDASTSMNEYWQSSPKFIKARNLLYELLDSLEILQKTQKIELALRLYGHQSSYPPADCKDSKLEVAFGENNISRIRDVMAEVKPKGTTPIAYSLAQCEYDFVETTENTRNIIILITDGIEMCDGDPCEISIALQKKGIVLKPYIIGVNINLEQIDILKCMGNYFNASNENEFRQAINTIISQVTNLMAIQVNLLDINNNPTETNVAMSFHDNCSGDIRYTYLHTMNAKGKPDTLFLDLLSMYDLKVHTIPPVYKDSIKLKENIFNIIEVSTPQGTLLVDIHGKDTIANNNVKYIIRKSGLPNTIYVADAEKKQNLIIGQYDLEILTMPRIYVDGVTINQSKITKIDIPEPGDLIINFKQATFASLLYEHGDVLTNLYDFSPEMKHYKFRLQPGYYRIIFREKKHKKYIHSSEYKFRVKSGSLIIENL